MRLIDADALKETVEKYRIVHLSHRRLSAIKKEAEEVINDICLGIDFAPTIDPVKRGKWIIHPEVKNIYGGIYIECSECGEKYVVQYIEDEKFCRNCGAKMEGEENERT